VTRRGKRGWVSDVADAAAEPVGQLTAVAILAFLWGCLSLALGVLWCVLAAGPVMLALGIVHCWASSVPAPGFLATLALLISVRLVTGFVLGLSGSVSAKSES